MKRFNYIFLFLIASIIGMEGMGQFSKIYIDADAEFKKAKDLYQQEKISLAYPLFKKLINIGFDESSIPNQIKLESRYYFLVCGLQLHDTAAVASAEEFIAFETNNSRVQMLRFHLGEYYYKEQKFSLAQTFYNGTNIANLSNREIADMKFHQAYGYFVMKQFDTAKPLFDAIRQLPKDPNYLDANYYYGFICFNEKKYTEALQCFEIAQKLTEYQSVIPFYITEIYYFKGESDKAVSYGAKAIQASGQYYDLQLNQLVGHIWFEKREFAKALPYLEKFVSAKEKVRREDLYELAYCYYEIQDWLKSIEGFKQLGGAEDSLAQNSMYRLGDAYLKIKDKPNARTAFQFCASNNSHALQKEVSAFNYGKLSYELGYLDQALKSFQAFNTNYPKSTYVAESKELLVNILANTSNYKEALKLYESLSSRSASVIKLYPGLLYGSAVELINDQKINDADSLLTKILSIDQNITQLPLTYFWKGEIAYRNDEIESSIIYFLNYLKKPVANGEVNEVNARYSLGYAYFKQENYSSAKENFEFITKSTSVSLTSIQQDAFIRSADCYFMNKDFAKSLKMYESVFDQRLASADYALYQKGIIAGALNKNAEKISVLQSLERLYPASALLGDASLEIANTYLADENYQSAIPPLKKIVLNTASVSLAPQAYLKLGVAYFNLNRNEESLDNFKKLVTLHPNTEESTDAIDYIRNIFIEDQKPAEFVEFMKSNGRSITNNEEDSLTFRSSMLRYEAKDMTGAKKGFTDYLSKFAQGKYSIEASYLNAEIYNDTKEAILALPFYKTVADQAQNKYAERSTLQVARIYYFELKDYPNAEKYFGQLKNISTQQENRLEAMRGLLRCQFKAGLWKEASPNAQDLLLEKGIATDDKMMANLVVAKNYQLNNEAEPAISAFKKVVASGKSEYAAESQFHIAELLLQQNKLIESEKAAFEVIKKLGSYEYWVTKSYVLLGDIYVTQKDLFNAEATYKSVVDNATIIEIKNEAQQKLLMIIEEKNKMNKVEQ